MQRALIVLGHGSRSPEATAQFVQIVDLLKMRYPDDLVLPAFMELTDPRLAAALASAVEQGCEDILVTPCFLFQGMHIKRDIPEMLEELKQTHPRVSVRFGRPIGPDPRIAEILADRVEELVCLV